MLTLGVDVGTTHTKALALDVAAGRVLALESAATPVVADERGEAHRPDQVLAVVIALLRSVVARLPDPAAVEALSVASVGEEVVLLDRAGDPLGDAITWYDPRGLAEADAFLAGEGGRLALSRRWPPDPTFSLFKLLWLRSQASAQLAAAVSWTDLGDFVLRGLGGALVMDWSHASRAGAFDIVERRWDQETIDVAGLGVSYPTLVPGGTVIGRLDASLARDLGLPPGVALVSGGHDHLCAAFGAGLRSTRELFLSAGTSEAHLSLLDRPFEGPAAAGVDQGCYVDDRAWYAHVNIHSGHFFRQWRELLYDGVDDETMYAEVAGAVTGSVRFDVADDQRLGRLESVPYDAGRAELMRAVLEGLARRSAAIVARLEAVAGQPYDLILVAGHPARIPLWRSLRERAYGRAMAQVLEPEATAFGAAAIAAVALDPSRRDDLAARRVPWA